MYANQGEVKLIQIIMQIISVCAIVKIIIITGWDAVKSVILSVKDKSKAILISGCSLKKKCWLWKLEMIYFLPEVSIIS